MVKIQKYGVSEATDVELLACLFSGASEDARMRKAKKVFDTLGGLRQVVASSCHEIFSISGMNERDGYLVEAVQELLRRSNREENPIVLTSPTSAGGYLLNRCHGWTEEHFGILATNSRGFLIADRVIGRGTASAVLMSPREIYREALRVGAYSIICWHNHPSGEVSPSSEDQQLTRKLRDTGAALGIGFNDHIIVGHNKYYSFRAQERWDL